MINNDLLNKTAADIIKLCQDRQDKAEYDAIYYKGAVAGVQELMGRLNNDSDNPPSTKKETKKPSRSASEADRAKDQ